MATEAEERFKDELGLLQAMYPDALSFAPNARELKYSISSDQETATKPPAVLLLRLPETYPLDGFPQVITALGHQKEDLRSAAKAAFSSLASPPGEEVLDALLLAFRDLVESQDNRAQIATSQATEDTVQKANALANRTVIIWLHHLLNTNKRKLALNPTMAGSGVSGVTKPGYPGVLIFSGQRNVVDAHMSELRNQRWQAFQVRYDTDDGCAPSEVWQFTHGEGIREVESMGDVVQSVTHPQHRDIFLGAIGVK
ncbi:hypothetical protein F4808DRAFT_295579 [Astrocystis sublimbata]|nr:hypothetical protein F4808DRAFT_295579 [Astrocystis sublimbata]